MAEPNDAPRSSMRSARLWAATLCMLGALAAMVLSSTRLTEAGEELYLSPLVVFEGGLLVAAVAAAFTRRVGAHVFVRAVLWGIFAVYGAGVSAGGGAAHLVAFLGSGFALLCLGGRGLDAADGAFAPRVLRRSLITMMVVAMCVAHIEGLLAAELLRGAVVSAEWTDTATLAWRVSIGVGVALAPVWLVLAVAGLARTRAWGLFAYLCALVWVGALGVVSRFDTHHDLSMILWFFGAVTLVAGLPVLSALVVKRRARPATEGAGPRVGEWAHALLVVVGIASALYVRYADSDWLSRVLD